MDSSSILDSLRGRLMVAFVGVILAPMLIVAAVAPGLARTHQLTTLENRLTDEAQVLADYVATQLEREPAAHLDFIAKRLGHRTQTRYTVITPDGTVVAESHQELAQVGNHATRREVVQALAGRRGVDFHVSETVGYPMLYVAVPITRGGTVVAVARTALPLSEVDRQTAELTQTILLTTAGGSLLAVAVALLAAQAITRPLGRLTRLAAAVADDPVQRGRVGIQRGPAEIVQLGRTLDRLAAAVRDSLQRVQGERDRLDAVLANLSDGIVIVDHESRIARVNAAAVRLLRLRGRMAAGRTVAEVLRAHELVEMVERAQTAGPTATVISTAFLEWQGPRRFLGAAVSRFGEGDSAQILLVLQDLTELRRLETVRRDFVTNVSHELRTPIASIKLMTETLRDGAIEEPDAARDFLARIEQEIDSLHNLVEELLELARLESGRVEVALEPTNPVQLLQTAVQRLAPMAERAQVSLAVEAAPDLPAVSADPARMGQVLVNLIHNAIKFTPPGGAIVVRAAPTNGRMQRSVTDTGAGIAPDLLSRIFERFYKTDQARAGEGTGLGLAIAKHTVQRHGGEIWAESDGPGRGTTVYVTLPLATAAQSG